MSPFFSIIIPTLNEEEFLPKLLTDLSQQKDKDFEIIIVDGNSSDKTNEVILKFKELPISFYRVKKRNVSYQRNFGATKAKGNYLIFLDADAGVFTSFTKNLKKIILREKGLVFIPSTVPDKNSSELKTIFKVVNFIIYFSQNLPTSFSTGGSMIFEKNFFNLIGGFEEKLYLSEDHNIIQKAKQWGVRAKFLADIKVKFCLRRLKKEGELKFFYKNLFSAAYLLLKGDIKKKIFEYEMGGEAY